MTRSIAYTIVQACATVMIATGVYLFLGLASTLIIVGVPLAAVATWLEMRSERGNGGLRDAAKASGATGATAAADPNEPELVDQYGAID